jgi:hypothetical protein
VKGVAIAIALAACTHAPAPVHNVKAEDVTALVAEADRLAESWEFDATQPFSGRSPRLERVRELRARACRSGHAASCWRAEMFAEVEANCRGGDVMSCRAIPPARSLRDERPDDTLPGRFGRSFRCRSTSCLKELAQECDAGYPRSCSLLVELAPGTGKEPHLLAAGARADRLSARGCGEGITAECQVLAVSSRLEDKVAASRIRCLDGGRMGECDVATTVWLALQQTEQARDMLEQACQDFRAPITCNDLARRYLTDELPEPEPGRGQRLRAWYCQQHKSGLATYDDCLLGRD